CANLAGLLLVRAIRRRREIAVRLALGASAATLLRQAILESLVLSFTGGIVGLLLAAAATRIGVQFLPETLPPPQRNQPRLASSSLRPRPGSLDRPHLRPGAGLRRHPHQRQRHAQGR